VVHKLTAEERRQALAALEHAQHHAAELLESQSGRAVPASWELLDEARAERTRQLVRWSRK
jgi:hypothetical protein